NSDTNVGVDVESTGRTGQTSEGPVHLSLIREHMEVVGSDGGHVGTVDSIEGEDRIKLTRSDPYAGGVHHWISPDDIAGVDDKVRLRLPAADAIRRQNAATFDGCPSEVDG
ncbi:MAG TPA: DUF2171 domain-containing protein, partial [Fimbriimonadaceae bacterium]|nr:DUF2171 domain-containing protein [Fimbriimonadaceae bacterium]